MRICTASFSCVLFFVAGLHGCASVDTVKTVQGCGVAGIDPGKITSISWAGPCKSGLADGTGELIIVTAKDTQRYVGEMQDGYVTGKGERFLSAGGSLRGAFVNWDLVVGKVILPNGAVLYDGTFMHGGTDIKGCDYQT